MSARWIDHKGKKILYSSFQGIKESSEAIVALKDQMRMIAESKEPVLLLVNMSGSVMSPESSGYAKDELSRLNAKVKKAALVGITGFKAVIVDSIGRQADMNQQVFETEESAKDWLVL